MFGKQSFSGLGVNQSGDRNLEWISLSRLSEEVFDIEESVKDLEYDHNQAVARVKCTFTEECWESNSPRGNNDRCGQ